MKQHFDQFWQQLSELDDSRFTEWRSELPGLVDIALHPEGNGNLPRWINALETICQYPSSQVVDLNQSAITANDHSLNEQDQNTLRQGLKGLMPWRKGPFNLQGIEIDTEWRSDWKWDRVRPHLPELKGKRILDIGCGSGYHLWRMAGEDPELAVGVDPNLLFLSQFLAVRHFVGQTPPVYFLPLTLEQLPTSVYGGAFDFVFSMGVLYHRRSPIDHIMDLKNQLRPGGTLILETLIVPESFGQLLVPEDRYAQMRNVWFLPSESELALWLRRCGFEDITCVDIDQTSIDEQRTTEWMEWNSLKDFLDPEDSSKTIEGYPAPLRAVMKAKKPK